MCENSTFGSAGNLDLQEFEELITDSFTHLLGPNLDLFILDHEPPPLLCNPFYPRFIRYFFTFLFFSLVSYLFSSESNYQFIYF